MNLPTVLIAEDNSDDYLLLERAFVRSELSARLHWVQDGHEARVYLEQSLSDPSRHPVPLFILGDVKMPRMDGFELLSWLKTHPSLKRIPFVMLSSSSQASDIKMAYEKGANSYLVKPGSFQDLLKLSLCLKSYWLSLNALPTPLPAHEET
jgi:CheY-like chemotaxis protein